MISGTRVNEVTNGFQDMKSFPRALGAVDGCHIQIKTPNRQENPAAYLNRKKDYSILLQVIIALHVKFEGIKENVSQKYSYPHSTPAFTYSS